MVCIASIGIFIPEYPYVELYAIIIMIRMYLRAVVFRVNILKVRCIHRQTPVLSTSAHPKFVSQKYE